VKSKKLPSSLTVTRGSLRGSSISIYIEDMIVAHAAWVVFMVLGVFLAYRVFIGRFKIARYLRRMRGYEVDK
jgi:hypothetical protein